MKGWPISVFCQTLLGSVLKVALPNSKVLVYQAHTFKLGNQQQPTNQMWFFLSLGGRLAVVFPECVLDTNAMK